MVTVDELDTFIEMDDISNYIEKKEDMFKR